jgi:hypothetical protein
VEKKISLLPIPETKISQKLIPVSTRKREPDNILNDLKMIARELHKDEKVRKVVINELPTILQKNADRDRNGKLILSGSKNRYGLKQFIFDLLINNEIDLVRKILKYFRLQYIDIADFLFDFPKYAMDQSLLFNYFMSGIDADWSELQEIMESVSESWILEEKLTLLTLLLNVSVSVGNDFLNEILVEVWRTWRDSVQEELDEMEDEDIDNKDQIINLVENLDILSIR